MLAVFNEGRKERAVHVKVLLEFKTRCLGSMVSISICEEYCYPSDLAIVALYEEKNKTFDLLELEFASEEDIVPV